MRRWLLALVAVLGLAVAAVAQDGALPGPDESDVGFITRILQNSLSDRGRAVRITGFEGALSSRATFETLTIADDDGVWLRVTDGALQWNRAALFQRRIEVAEISAKRVALLRAPRAAADPDAPLVPAPRFTLPDLPVAVTLGALQLDEVVVAPALLGQELRAQVTGRADLEGGAGSARLEVARLGTPEGRFALDAAFSNATRNLSLELDAVEGPGGIAVSRLGVPGRPAAALRIAGDGPIDDFAADISLATDGTPRVDGRFTLRDGGDSVRQSVGLALSGDLRPLLAPEFRPFFGAESRLRTQARRFDDGRLALDELDIATQTLRVQGRARMGADGLPELIELQADLAGPDGERVLLPLAGADTRVRRATLHLDFDAAQSQDWDMTLDLQEFDNGRFAVKRAVADGLGRIASEAFGEARNTVDALVDVTTTGVRARDPDLSAALGEQITGSLAVIWRQGQPFLLPGFLIEGSDYALQGRARLHDGVVTAEARAELSDIGRLSGLAERPLSGAVRARIDGRFGPDRDSFALNGALDGQDLGLDQPALDALLSGDSRITLDASGADGTVTLDRLQAQARTLRADLGGTLSAERVALAGDLDFTDLSVLGARYGGALAAQLRVDGPSDAARVTLDGTARDLTFGQPQLDRALSGRTTLRAEGTRDGTAFDLAALSLDNAALSLSAGGRYAPGATALDAQASLPDLGALRPGLGGAVNATATLRADGARRAFEIQATARDIALGAPAADRVLAGRHALSLRGQAEAGQVLLDELALSGPALSADVSGQLRDGRPDLDISARLADIALLAPGIDGPLALRGTARDTGSGYALDLSADGPAGLQADLAGTVAPDLQADLRLRATTDLALINPRIEPRSIQGPGQAEVTLRGPLTAPRITGTASMRDVTLVEPRRNLRLVGVQADVGLGGGQANVALTGDGAQGGRVSVDGPITLAPPFEGDLRVQLDGFGLVNPQLFETDITGALRIAGPLARGAAISGDVRLDRMEIRIPRVGLSGRAFVPPGIRHAGDGDGARTTRARAGIFAGETYGRTRYPAPLDLTIRAPNRIFLRGRGLDAELGGTLRLTGTSADVIPIGQFGLIRGRLDLLGNRFTLNEGFASLQGQFMPYVRLIAATERDGVNARIVLEGPADAPEIKFESSPALPEEEILSQLLFGRSYDSLSLFQAAQLASSLATLSGRSEGLLARLRGNIGLDDLDVRTDADGETALRLGSYLTENVYTDVEVTADGDSEVSINIDLSDSVTARGQVDDTGRGSIGVFFERDY